MLLAWLCAAAMGALAVYMEHAMYWTVRLTFEPMDLGKIQPEEGIRMLKMVSCMVMVFYVSACASRAWSLFSVVAKLCCGLMSKICTYPLLYPCTLTEKARGRVSLLCNATNINTNRCAASQTALSSPSCSCTHRSGLSNSASSSSSTGWDPALSTR